MIIQPSNGYIGHIQNPKSGSDQARALVDGFTEYLRTAGFDVRTRQTRSPEHCRELTETFLHDPSCALILAGGGDGTVSEILDTVSRIDKDKKVMLIPCGTMNLLARELGYRLTLDDLIDTFKNGIVHPLDMGRANGRGFACVAGFGIDGEVVRLVDEQRKGHITGFHYFWPIWRSFWRHRFPPMRVYADGDKIFTGSGQVLVGNIARYGLALRILDQADFSDGQLDVCIFKSRSRLRLLLIALLTLLKLHKRTNDVIYRQARKVRVEQISRSVYSELDGDPGPDLPVDIEVVPAAVSVVGPRRETIAGIVDRVIKWTASDKNPDKA